ncbi:replication protein a 70 kda dna-binding subunit b, partial [Quercus suber]
QNILLCSKLLITLVVLIVTNKGYRPVSNDLNIIFLLTTSVKECNEESELIPMHAFAFATYNCINNRLNDNSYLTDMIGKLTTVGPIEQVHFDSGSTNIRNLQILLPDMDGKAVWMGRRVGFGPCYLAHTVKLTRDKELKISLWDESAETITKNDFKEDEGPYIIIVTSTIVKAFQGKLNLNTTSASKVYVSELIDRYKVVEDEYDNVVRSIPARDKKPKSESKLILQTTMSLAEIKALEWVEGVKEIFFTCYADIVNIEIEFGWNHITCQLCKRKVKQQNNIYKLKIQVKDHTGTASFVLFDKDAEKIIQKTAMELSLKNQEPNKVPQEIQNLLGKSYTFQIEVDDYNVKEGWEVYTVTSVFKSESNKHSENIVANNIQIKPSKTLFSHHQTIANNPIATSDIKLLTSLKDVTDDNLIDDVFRNTQLVRRQKLIINCLIITFLTNNVFLLSLLEI